MIFKTGTRKKVDTKCETIEPTNVLCVWFYCTQLNKLLCALAHMRHTHPYPAELFNSCSAKYIWPVHSCCVCVCFFFCILLGGYDNSCAIIIMKTLKSNTKNYFKAWNQMLPATNKKKNIELITIVIVSRWNNHYHRDWILHDFHESCWGLLKQTALLNFWKSHNSFYFAVFFCFVCLYTIKSKIHVNTSPGTNWIAC